LNNFSPLSVIQYDGIPYSSDSVSNFGVDTIDEEMSMKYRLVQYTKTHLHYTLVEAALPVIRPLFYQFSSEKSDQIYDAT